MVSTSKILTVSYGTFSCTLEGFDDPFLTMRSIAEYFRDLAADDRYFGAEPPTPDVEMLHRIAEREAQRKVDAQIKDNTVILRQTESALPDSNAITIPDQAAVEIQDTVASESLVQQVVSKQPVTSPILTGEEPEALIEPVIINEKPAEEDKVSPADLSDTSIGAKLQRLRAAAVSSTMQPENDTDNSLENGLGEDFFSGSPEVNADDDELTEDAAIEIADISEDAPIVNVEQEPVAEQAEEPVDEAEVFARISAATTDANDDSGLDSIDTPRTETADVATDNIDEDTDILSGISAALEHGITAEPTLSDNDFDAEFDAEFDDEDEAFEDENEAATDHAPEPVAIARIIKVRRAAAPDLTSEQPDEITDPQDEQVSDLASEDTTLSDDDEASLLADLAKVEREAEEEAAIIHAGQKDTGDALTLTAFDDADYTGTDALDRIMAETNTKIDSDEASHKRTSIAHLRAAVQAKRADHKSGDVDEGNDNTSEEYRDDLARVVQPGRPKQTRKSLGRRLAPLVLVSEQRVDEITPAAQIEKVADSQGRTPVRPRRVRKAQSKDSQATGANGNADTLEANEVLSESFATFVSQNQAEGAAELFEAAAAFRIYVKGQETFSRPQVMRLVLTTSPDSTLSREDALRAFGQLIRGGMIKKIQRGRYTISENTRFRPGLKRARA